ncbi:MAG: hypothetical protein P8Y54_04300 [Xanthomonadales bacterium]
MLEREVKRYAAYFRGWCQAFGEHESLADHERDVFWLVTDEAAGFVLPATYQRQLYREILLHRTAPTLTFRSDRVEVGGFQLELARQYETRILDSIGGLLASDRRLHVYLTSHLMYGTAARILTLSAKKPLLIIYKEIGTLRIRLDRPAPPRPGTAR